MYRILVSLFGLLVRLKKKKLSALVLKKIHKYTLITNKHIYTNTFL